MINLIKHKNIPFIISSTLFLLSVILLGVFGLKPGIDFTGGSLMEVSFSGERPSLEQMQQTTAPLEEELGSVLVQPIDEDSYLVKTPFISEEQHQIVLQTIRTAYQTEENIVREERVETIGPTVSSQLKERAFLAAIAVIVAIILYVAYAFRKASKQQVSSWKYGVTAIIALIHDVTITMAVFALLGKYAGVEVDIPFVVALLTILGYSVNDTIVVFDRIRENLIKKTGHKFEDMVNMGVNESFTRSVNTSVTTLIVLVAVYLFGGDSVHYFSLALIIGIIVGTYSSIFLASPLLVVWQQLAHKK
ncbi:MAG: protein translocase subunit SecF [Candidatus Magasanikbacteria bacterium]|uniref:Protein-export membrane protein SecF n=1 Tax=Candidatus Magasanikbacteria bacterium CG10_big_fil_rev_8_21_14_0_10_38_6 TaxID=1974647 RepID=A0A2M6P237_9BACT|nr:protein translocase subunit SecF [Candidatus Magasanikbacteria bacterium]NCS71664.1 protein translocase subunit SecF [Candidatus Magasanikbacteria bacterium]PIR77748.1 MAG: protein translocase subunit SecF [Candidatus Magasanikbacteria bacterium CG10_big_fil_rev_8_21_14_0_10_38_6]